MGLDICNMHGYLAFVDFRIDHILMITTFFVKNLVLVHEFYEASHIMGLDICNMHGYLAFFDFRSDHVLMITTFRVTRTMRGCTLPTSESATVCLYGEILVTERISIGAGLSLLNIYLGFRSVLLPCSTIF
jgi:hypothetical protein